MSSLLSWCNGVSITFSRDLVVVAVDIVVGR
jgi:hypothetical protein